MHINTSIAGVNLFIGRNTDCGASNETLVPVQTEATREELPKEKRVLSWCNTRVFGLHEDEWFQEQAPSEREAELRGRFVHGELQWIVFNSSDVWLHWRCLL